MTLRRFRLSVDDVNATALSTSPGCGIKPTYRFRAPRGIVDWGKAANNKDPNYPIECD